MKYIIPPLSLLLLTACTTQRDDFEPGPAVPESNIGAYFVNDYAAQNIYEDQPTSDTLWLTAVRTRHLDAAQSVPLIIDEADTDKIHIPQSVDFGVGEDTARVGLTFPDVELSKEYAVQLHLDDNYCNPYAKVDGSPSVSCSVLWSDWDVICDTVRVIGSWVVTKYQGSRLLNFRGQNRFRLTNFLNSGIPFEFSIDGSFDEKDPRNSYGKVNPLSHYYDGGSYWSWGLDDWASWTLDGLPKTISYVSFYPSYGFDNIDLRLLSPKTFTLGGKKYQGEDDFSDTYRNVELVAINGAWDYVYFYFYYPE